MDILDILVQLAQQLILVLVLLTLQEAHGEQAIVQQIYCLYQLEELTVQTLLQQAELLTVLILLLHIQPQGQLVKY